MTPVVEPSPSCTDWAPRPTKAATFLPIACAKVGAAEPDESRRREPHAEPSEAPYEAQRASP